MPTTRNSRNRDRGHRNNIVASNMPVLTPQNTPYIQNPCHSQDLESDSQNFDGNPDYLNYFISQFKEEARLKNWSDERLLHNIKKKLKGKAFEFMIQSQEIREFSSSEELFEKLKGFFIVKSEIANICEFDSLTMLPGESITHLAHRIEVLVHKINKGVTDQNAINKQKFNKFINIIPTNIRSVILMEQITDFSKAVEKASLAQVCLADNLKNDTNDTWPVPQERINHLQDNEENKNANKPFHNENNFRGKAHLRQNNHRNQYKTQNRIFNQRFSHHGNKQRFSNRGK